MILTKAKETETPGAKPQNWEWWICVGLFFLTFLVFGQALSAKLLPWDDDINIYHNAHLGAPTLERLQWMFTDFKYQWRYQPLGWLSWSIIYAFNGLEPFGYHFANLLLHGLNAVLVFWLIRRLLKLLFPAAGPQAILISAGLGAALWAFHPMRVEAVAWAVELLYDQALFFLLLSLLCYLQAVRIPILDNRRSRFYRASLLLFIASLLSFPLAFAYVAVLVALDIFILKRFTETSQRWSGSIARTVWVEKIPFVLATALAFAANIYCRTHTTGPWEKPVTLEQFDLFSRVMQAFYVWAYYLWRPCYPFDLSPVYPQLIAFQPLAQPFVASAAGIIGVTIFLFFQRHRFPALLALWISYLALLVPMLGLTEHPHYPSDRYSLIVSIGIATMLAAVLLRLQENVRYRQQTLVLGGALVMGLSVLSFQQTRIWQTPDTFFTHILDKLGKHPYRAEILLRVANLQAERNDKLGSIESLKEALVAVPNLPDVNAMIGSTYAGMNKLAEAEKYLTAELTINPKHTNALINLSLVEASLGKIGPAVQNFQYATKLAPQAISAPQAAVFFKMLALANAQNGKLDLAVKMAQRSVSIAQTTKDKNLIEEMNEVLKNCQGAQAAWEKQNK